MPEIVDLTVENVLTELLRGADVQPSPKDELIAESQLRAELFAEFEKIAELPANQVPGETLTRVGPYHIKLKSLILDASVAVAGIAMASLAGPLTLVAIGPVILPAVVNLRHVLRRMSAVEVSVYDAIAEIQRDAMGPGGIPSPAPTPRGSKQDIIDFLMARDGSAPLGLGNVLQDLSDNGIVRKTSLNDETIYLAV
jgi:hypothetical protein